MTIHNLIAMLGLLAFGIAAIDTARWNRWLAIGIGCWYLLSVFRF